MKLPPKPKEEEKPKFRFGENGIKSSIAYYQLRQKSLARREALAKLIEAKMYFTCGPFRVWTGYKLPIIPKKIELPPGRPLYTVLKRFYYLNKESPPVAEKFERSCWPDLYRVYVYAGSYYILISHSGDDTSSHMVKLFYRDDRRQNHLLAVSMYPKNFFKGEEIRAWVKLQIILKKLKPLPGNDFKHIPF